MKNNNLSLPMFAMFFLLVTAVFTPRSIHAAANTDAVVGTGTPASCTEDAFNSAFNTVQTGGGGTITFNCGGAATITFSDQKILLENTTIDGAGKITLSGGKKTRLFLVNTGLTLALQNLTMRDGFTNFGGGLIEIFGGSTKITAGKLLDSTAGTNGGAIYCSNDPGGAVSIIDSVVAGNSAKIGGAIYSGGCSLTIFDSELKNNKVPAQVSGTGLGGAIYLAPKSKLQLTGTLVEGNESYNGGGLLIDTQATAKITESTISRNMGSYGAGIENRGKTEIAQTFFEGNEAKIAAGGLGNFNGILSVTQSKFYNNSGGIGGAIVSNGLLATLSHITVDGNEATNQGGGIYLQGGDMYIFNSTINNNKTVQDNGNGGGLYQSSGSLQIKNSTVTGNRAPNAAGGGFFRKNGLASLVYVTLADNQAAGGSQIHNFGTEVGELTLFGTALAGDKNSCAGLNFLSFGYNMAEGPCPFLNQIGDKAGLGSLKLGPLWNYGGPTGVLTMLPAADSPLIDAIPPSQCDQSTFIDQRVMVRPSGSGCDVGAVERQPTDGPISSTAFFPFINR